MNNHSGDQDDIKIFKSLLNKISVKELNDRINKFRHFVDLSSVSEEELKKQLNNLLTVSIDGEPYSFF